MPLLLITGFPACGKSTICRRLYEYFGERLGSSVHVVDDEMDINFSRSSCGDFRKEKELRSALRANVQRMLDQKILIICDSLNHIKGYRYEMFCLAKNMETRYAVLKCTASPQLCKWLNKQRNEDERYPEEVLLNLIGRYEAPDPKNRWDTPLFEVQIGEETTTKNSSLDEEKEESYGIPTIKHEVEENFHPEEENLPLNVSLPVLDHLFSALIEGKGLNANRCMKPQAPLVPSNFLIELDQRTQAIVNRLIQLQRSAMTGDKLVVLEDTRAQANKVNFTRQRSLPQLTRVRQQFITYMKAHPVDELECIGPLFVNYLNSNS